MAAKKNKGGRPQIGEEPIDIVSSIRLAKSDRAKIAAGAAACGMNKTMFMRQAVLNICELVTSDRRPADVRRRPTGEAQSLPERQPIN